jgi:drug/metabolite transporter (DMT)-like permease
VFEEEKSPNITDYLASATLSYGITFLWLKLSTMMEMPWFFAYLFFYIAGLGPSYLICQRTTRNQFPVAMISAVFSWIFTLVCLITFTQGDPMGFFKMLLVLYLLGGLTSAIIKMRDRLRPKKPDES